LIEHLAEQEQAAPDRFADDDDDRRDDLINTQEPAEGSPSSAGSCVPAIGYPLRGPGALAGGPEGAHERDARAAHIVPSSMP